MLIEFLRNTAPVTAPLSGKFTSVICNTSRGARTGCALAWQRYLSVYSSDVFAQISRPGTERVS